MLIRSRRQVEREVEALALVVQGALGREVARVPVGAEPLLVGRAKPADVRLDDPMVSGMHAKIVVSDGNVVIRDLASRNGTYLNDVRIVESVIYAGDEVRVGNTRILVRPAHSKESTYEITKAMRTSSADDEDEGSRTSMDLRVPRGITPVLARAPRETVGRQPGFCEGEALDSAIGRAITALVHLAPCGDAVTIRARPASDGLSIELLDAGPDLDRDRLAALVAGGAPADAGFAALRHAVEGFGGHLAPGTLDESGPILGVEIRVRL